MIETLQDVELFIATLENTNMLWHADDSVDDIPSFANLSSAQRTWMQESMNTAIEVCEREGKSVFEYYNLED